LSDRELLDRIARDDEEAFASVFRTHYPSLVGAAQAMLGDRGRAEEVVQDVLLELWRRRHTIAIESTLRAYLQRATRNRALNVVRHEKVAQRMAPLAADDPVVRATDVAGVVESEIDRDLHEAVTHLPARCREVFELSRVQGLRYAEIAETLGISVKTVEAQMGKALRILRERMAKWLPESGEL
jgi:RNA polymerase sigma-70 factor (ECF subfamily)